MYLLLLTVFLFAFHPAKANEFHRIHNDSVLRPSSVDYSRNVHNDLSFRSVQTKESPHAHDESAFQSVKDSDSFYMHPDLALRPTGTNDSISIQTLNIYGPFYAESLRLRELFVLEFLKKDNGDINLFQEVWFEYYYENMEKVSQSVGMNSVSYDALAKNEKKSGLVTIARGTVHKKEIHFFPLGGDPYDVLYSILDINKGFGIAHITHPKFPEISFWAVNIHLHHLNQNIRLLQLIHYLKWFLNKTTLQDPIILGGDFNFEPDSLEFEMLQNMFRFEEPQTYLGLNYSCTICEENKFYIGYNLSKLLLMDYEKTTDYIFLKSSPRVAVVVTTFNVFPKKYNGIFISDHYGLRVDITFRDNQEAQKLISEEELEKRKWKFFKTLDKVQSKLDRGFSSEHQFLSSLRSEFEKPDNILLQHLKQH